MANRLVEIGLIALVFLGSIGIPLYRHSCSHEQITIQTLFTMSDHCEAEAETEDSCCEKAVPEQSESVDDNCCTDEVKRLSLSFDYFESAHFELPTWVAVIPLPVEFRFVPVNIPSDEPVIVCQITEPPPKPLGERLPVNCCWRL